MYPHRHYRHPEAPNTGAQTLSQEKLAPLGGTVGIGLRVQMGAGERLARDAQGQPLASTGSIRVKDSWDGYKDGVTAQTDFDFTLTGSGWQELLNPGTNDEAWAPSAAPSTCDGTQATARIFFYWVPETWNTQTGPEVKYNGAALPNVPPMGHNGKHAVYLGKLNGQETDQPLKFQHYDALNDGWQAPYGAGPAPKEATVANLVVTRISATQGTVDYLKYDPDPASPYHRPRIDFTFKDSGDQHQYYAWAMIQKTGRAGMEFVRHEDMYAVADTYIQGPVQNPGSYYAIWNGSIITNRYADRTFDLSGPDEADWGTYTYDIIVAEYDSQNQLIDQFAYIWPYCLTVGEHTITVQNEGEIDTIKCSYKLEDNLGKDAERLSICAIDENLQETDAISLFNNDL